MSLAGRLRRDGAGEVAIFQTLAVENESACRPPLDTVEVARVAANAAKYPSGGGAATVDEVLKAAGIAALNRESPVAEREAAIRRLRVAVGPLDTVGRALLRDELTRRYEISAVVADSVVHQPKCSDATPQQGAALLFTEPEPWSDAVAGPLLLDELVRTILAYVVLPSPSAVALALWILHTHALDAAQISPRCAVISPEKRCGKTTVLKLLNALVRRPMQVANLTSAVVFRCIEAHQPTLLIDEADTFLRDHDELRGVLNAGHDRQSAVVARCVGDESEPRVFRVWAPVAFAGIGKQHDTLMDRSIVIAMKRRSPGERVAPFRRRERDALGTLNRKCARWARDNLERLRSAEPVPAPGLDDRAVDNWEALLAIADVAGGFWPDSVRAAAQSLATRPIRRVSSCWRIFARSSTTQRQARFLQRPCLNAWSRWRNGHGQRPTTAGP
jgi:putative DNA primase/helicase